MMIIYVWWFWAKICFCTVLDLVNVCQCLFSSYVQIHAEHNTKNSKSKQTTKREKDKNKGITVRKAPQIFSGVQQDVNSLIWGLCEGGRSKLNMMCKVGGAALLSLNERDAVLNLCEKWGFINQLDKWISPIYPSAAAQQVKTKSRSAKFWLIRSAEASAVNTNL